MPTPKDQAANPPPQDLYLYYKIPLAVGMVAAMLIGAFLYAAKSMSVLI